MSKLFGNFDHDHPLESSGFFSYYCLTWLNPLLNLGNSRPLTEDDVWELSEKSKCHAIISRFSLAWKEEAELNESKVSSMKVLSKLFWPFYLTTSFINCLFILGITIPRIAISSLLDSIQDKPVQYFKLPISDEYSGYFYAFLLFACFGSVSFFVAGMYTTNVRLGSAVRTALMAAVYRRLVNYGTSSSLTSKYASVGTSVNSIITSDVERVWQACLFCQWLWGGPVVVIVSVGLLIGLVGLPAVIGVIILLSLFPLQLYMAAAVRRHRQAMVVWSDKRIQLTTEVLAGIRVVKFYGWEQSFAKKISKLRDKELEQLQNLMRVRALNTGIVFLAPTFSIVSVFVLAALLDKELTVTFVFSTVALFTVLRPIIYIMPLVVSTMAECLVAFERIDKLLNQSNDDAAWWNVSDREQPLVDDQLLLTNTAYIVEFRNASFVWSQVSFRLEDINMCLSQGSFTCVVGRVGSGKSSLVHALLGEMPLESGVINRNDGLLIGYCGQEPWIQNATLKDNVLFYSEYVELAYKTAIRVSQLELDIASLPNNDETEIGERGITLSGGQKARVAVARMAYHSLVQQENCEYLVIMDDILSAVDAHVARDITADCIYGVLRNRTRVLTLNSHYELLVHADNVIVLDGGKIVFQGLYANMPRKLQEIYRADAGTDKSKEELKFNNNDNDDVNNLFRGTMIRQTTDEKVDVSRASLYNKETKATGKVSADIWKGYFSASYPPTSGMTVLVTLLLLVIVVEFVRVGSDYWLSIWTEGSLESPYPGLSTRDYFVMTYLLWVVGVSVIAFLRYLFFCVTALRSSKQLHNEQLNRILAAPVNLYFDVTPMGRILNRFAKDLDSIDCQLPEFMNQFLQNAIFIFGIIVVCGFSVPYFLVVIIPTLVYFLRVRKYFAASSLELKRIEAVSRSPIYSLFSETLGGLSSIRAMGKWNSFTNRLHQAVDFNSKVFVACYACLPWLILRLDLISAVIILSVSLGAFIFRDDIEYSLAGLAIAYSVQLMGQLQQTVRTSMETENHMTAVERLIAFRSIPQESQTILDEDIKTDEEAWTRVSASHKSFPDIEMAQWIVTTSNWAKNGSIEFKDVWVRYRPELPYVLKKFSATINGHQKIGICGRTGSGKSTIAMSLFRLVELSQGSIEIDGVDIRSVPLSVLRGRMSIIPQDPVLFKASIRENIDIRGEYEDEQIWDALKQAQLDDVIRKVGGSEGLSAQIGDSCASFSVGQKQLLCLARIILRQSSIVLLDEATSSIDSATDSIVQATVRKSLPNATFLIIAHRLETILDSDIMIIMADGSVVECGPPQVLRSYKTSD